MATNDCKLCEGSGKKLIPIRNVANLALKLADGLVIPNYFTQLVDCDCRKLVEIPVEVFRGYPVEEK